MSGHESAVGETGIAQLLVDLMAANGGLSQRELAKELGLSPNTVNRLITTDAVPVESTLDAIARFADLPITRVREIAQRSPGEPDRFVLPREFDQLTGSQRDIIRKIGWAFLAVNGRRVTR